MKITTKINMFSITVFFIFTLASLTIVKLGGNLLERAQLMETKVQTIKESSLENISLRDLETEYMNLLKIIRKIERLENVEEFQDEIKKLDDSLMKLTKLSENLTIKSALGGIFTSFNNNIKEFLVMKRKELDKRTEFQQFLEGKASTEQLNKINNELITLRNEFLFFTNNRLEGNIESIYYTITPYVISKNNENQNLIGEIEEISDLNSKVISRTLNLSIQGVVFVLFLLIVFSYLIYRSIKKPLTMLLIEAKKVENLDLNTDFSKLKLSGEMSLIGDSFQKITDSIKGIITDIDSVIKHMGNEADTIRDTILRNGASQEELSATFGEINNSVEASVGKLAESDEKAKSMGEEAKLIMKIVNNINSSSNNSLRKLRDKIKDLKLIITRVEGIGTQIENSTREISELDKVSNEVNGFIAKIYGITEQTNLLALNAAIEASRAGEAGRGFAVVADEIRKLANISRDTAKEIEEKMSEINKLIVSNVKSAEANKQSVQESLQGVNTINEVIVNTLGAFETLNSDLENIYTSVESQEEEFDNFLLNSKTLRTSFEEIKDRIREMDYTVEDSAKNINDLGENTQVMTELAEQTSSQIDKFKI